MKLKFKHSLKQHALIFGLMKSIIEKIKEIENWESLKADPDLIFSVATSIEEEISKSKIKTINKKDLVVEVFKMVYDLTDEEKEVISKILDYQLNNKLIKKKNVFLQSLKWVKSYVWPKTPDSI